SRTCRGHPSRAGWSDKGSRGRALALPCCRHPQGLGAQGMKPSVFLALVGLGALAGAPATAGSAPAASASPQHVPASVTVTIEAFQFSPSPLKVPVGTPVVFVNKDPMPHTVTPDGQSFQGTGRLVSGASKTVVFEKPGTFKCHCEIHPSMLGKVVVNP